MGNRASVLREAVLKAGGVVVNFKGKEVSFESQEIVGGNKVIVEKFIANTLG